MTATQVVDQWHRTEIQKCTRDPLIFHQAPKTTKLREDGLFNIWGCSNWKSTSRRVKLNPYLTPCRANSKWISGVNEVTATVLEENTA
jgi:hypothetical protein